MVLLQRLSGAFRAEFNAPDEAAHYVTGLMIRDYVRARLPGDPMAFATNFYVHYPKVSFGIWPPLFHIVEAAWMLLWSPSRTSVLLLLAATVSLLAWLLYRAAAREWGVGVGAAVALVFVLLPTTQYVTSRVNADALVALLVFASTLAWARVMERERVRDAVAFGLLGGAAMLTKGNGCALLLVPFVSLLVGGRLALMRTKVFWLGPAIMLVVGGPWQIYSWMLLRRTVVGVGVDTSTIDRGAAYMAGAHTELGAPLLLFALAGLATVVWHRRRPAPAIWVAMAATPAAVFAFHTAVPLTPSNRYLLSAAPALSWLAALGASSLLQIVVSERHAAWRPAILAILAVPVLAVPIVRVPWKAHRGIDTIADLIEQNRGTSDGVVLASGTSDGEGALVAEMAMRDRRPGHIVLRGSKMLSRSTWDGSRYELLYHDTQAVRRFLDDAGIAFVVIDPAAGGSGAAVAPDTALLMQTMAEGRGDWRLAAAVHGDRPAGQAILMYECSRVGRPRGRRIVIDMRYSLGRVIALR